MTNATVQVAHRHWWVFLTRGILALLFGIIALADPLIVLRAFIFGISLIIYAFQIRSRASAL